MTHILSVNPNTLIHKAADELQKQTLVIRGNVLSVVKKISKESFDIVYADPPYEQAEELILVLQFFDEHALISKGGTLFLEEGYPSKRVFPPLRQFFHTDSRHFGKSVVHKFTR